MDKPQRHYSEWKELWKSTCHKIGSKASFYRKQSRGLGAGRGNCLQMHPGDNFGGDGNAPSVASRVAAGWDTSAITCGIVKCREQTLQWVTWNSKEPKKLECKWWLPSPELSPCSMDLLQPLLVGHLSQPGAGESSRGQVTLRRDGLWMKATHSPQLLTRLHPQCSLGLPKGTHLWIRTPCPLSSEHLIAPLSPRQLKQTDTIALVPYSLGK